MGIECYGLTDKGRIRESNQDQFLIAELGRALVVHRSSLPVEDQSELKGPAFAQLFAVADGVGGEAGGERASLITVRTLLHYTLGMLPWCVRVDPRHDDDLVEELRFALDTCQSRLVAEADTDASMARMATTLTMGFVVWPRAYVLHVGDSRCYHVSAGELIQITADQTMARELVKQGTITESGVRRSPWRNVLSNALNAGEGSGPDSKVHRVDLELGDTLLFCSDGLTEHLPDDEIRDTLNSAASAEDACSQLVDQANAAGGSDNITCVVARFFDTALVSGETVRFAN